MEALLKPKEIPTDFDNSKLSNIKHPALKKIIRSKEKILLLFVSNLKKNLFQIRKLSQICRNKQLSLQLIHTYQEEEFDLLNQSFQLVVESKIADPDGYLFDKFHVDYNCDISILKRSYG